RYHADRFCRRQARADADRGGRDGRSRAKRIDGGGGLAGAADDDVLAARPGNAPQRTARGSARAAEFERTARDSAATAGRRNLRPAPRPEGQYTRALPAFCRRQWTTDDARAPRAARAGAATAHRIKRTDHAFGQKPAAKPQ